MSPDTVRAVCRRLSEEDLVGDHLVLVWHAGEPLVAPIAFYREACDIIDAELPGNTSVHHALQTNATLVDDRWCEFFRERDFGVGVSLDGPAFLHDTQRRTRAGRGSHDKVVAGLRRLQEHDIDPHVICVLTRSSLDHPDDLYDFFVSHGVRRVGFNVEELEGVNEATSLLARDTEAALARFLVRFLQRVAADDHVLTVREFDDFIETVRSGRPKDDLNDQVVPWRVLSVDHEGGFSTFSPELLGFSRDAYGSFVFGNVLRGSIRRAESSPGFQLVHRDIAAGVRRCREECEYFSACGGGAPANKLFETGTFDATETVYCRLMHKTVADVLLAGLAEGPLEYRGREC